MTFSITIEGMYAAIIACTWLITKCVVTWYATKKQFSAQAENN
jgi:hypothetical protein